MKQIAKNLTDFDGFLLGKEYLLMDRDGKFCPAFRKILIDEGVEPLLLPPRSTCSGSTTMAATRTRAAIRYG
jgi:hypothetical protein